MFSDTQREEKFEHANKTQRLLYGSPEAGIRIYEIAKKHSVPESQNIQFALAIGDVILGLVPQEKLPELLVERLDITQAEAFRITADVLDFLAPLDQPEVAETAAAQTESTPVPINNTEPTNDNSLASEIAEAEAAMESMQPIRTMSHDMEVKRGISDGETTHTAASQADLLNRTATVKDKNLDARWGTEQT